MNFNDVLIPLFGGIYLLVSGENFLKPMDPSFEKKKTFVEAINLY